MEARITAHSQPYRLRERMEEAQVRHGTGVRVDLPGVRVMAFADSWFSSIAGAIFNTPGAGREGEVSSVAWDGSGSTRRWWKAMIIRFPIR
jgi:hypothetical protein